jgi:hypothetical protein
MLSPPNVSVCSKIISLIVFLLLCVGYVAQRRVYVVVIEI